MWRLVVTELASGPHIEGIAKGNVSRPQPHVSYIADMFSDQEASLVWHIDRFRPQGAKPQF